mmetsp:Transcript_14742/g.42452  ORF Transcript_14742/g.42452 Transcript_14742/m.42452 type:complete len:250 (+) Transcript_14742:1342-2091(+)
MNVNACNADVSFGLDLKHDSIVPNPSIPQSVQGSHWRRSWRRGRLTYFLRCSRRCWCGNHGNRRWRHRRWDNRNWRRRDGLNDLDAIGWFGSNGEWCGRRRLHCIRFRAIFLREICHIFTGRQKLRLPGNGSKPRTFDRISSWIANIRIRHVIIPSQHPMVAQVNARWCNGDPISSLNIEGVHKRDHNLFIEGKYNLFGGYSVPPTGYCVAVNGDGILRLVHEDALYHLVEFIRRHGEDIDHCVGILVI